MKISKENFNKIWVAYFGNAQEAFDPFGFKMKRNLYGQKIKYGWDADHIWPKNPDTNVQGANVFANMQPLSHFANQEKDNKLQGAIEGITFAISKYDITNNEKIIGRMSIREDDDWYWAYDKPKY